MINHHQMEQICFCIVILFWLEAYKHHRVILPTLLSVNDFLRMTQLYIFVIKSILFLLIKIDNNLKFQSHLV